MKKKLLPTVLLLLALGAYIMIERNGSNGDGSGEAVTDAGTAAVPAAGQPEDDAGGTYARPAGWMEIPAYDDADYSNLYTFDMTVGGVTQRNYTLKWNENRQTADWVAYPLCRGNIGEGERSNAFGICPYMPLEIQPVLVEAYRKGNGGWYSRGHQIPSGDRRQYKANVQTFYGVNMTPQDEDLNGGIWGSLENRLRYLARKCDTLYIVTGCTYDGYSGEYVRDNEGRHVAVPTGYYKAALMRKGTSFHACAFEFENRPYGDNGISRSMAISLAELERHTGIEFFPALRAMVGESAYKSIKSENPATQSCWGN